MTTIPRHILPKEDILNIEETHVPQLLKTFVNELVQAPLKQVSISQALFSGTHPRSIMPLQFGLSVAVDNRLSSKWLNILLSKLGFGVRYDEGYPLQTECCKA